MTDDGGLFIKICGLTSEADALLAVGLGADAVGFVFAPSSRQVAPGVVADIVKRLPHGVLTVGVFRDEAPARVVELTNRIGLGAAQLHGHETAEESRWVRQRVACTIKAFVAGDRMVKRFAEFGADYLLIDGPSPGSGEVFDWRLGEGVARPDQLIVSGGLRPGNVAQAVAHLKPFGVDVSSGVESSPGRKDPKLLAEFIGSARASVARAGAARPGAAGGGMIRAGADGLGPERGRDGAGELSDGEEGGPYDWMEG